MHVPVKKTLSFSTFTLKTYDNLSSLYCTCNRQYQLIEMSIARKRTLKNAGPFSHMENAIPQTCLITSKHLPFFDNYVFFSDDGIKVKYIFHSLTVAVICLLS